VKMLSALVLVLALLSQVYAAQENDMVMEMELKPEPRVGVPSQLELIVRDGAGNPVKNVRISVNIEIAEEGLALFSGSFFSPDGRLSMLYHFQDASEHAINVIARAPDGRVIKRTFLVEVELPEPPNRVWFKTWIFLMGVLLLGILLGISGVVLRSRQSAGG